HRSGPRLSTFPVLPGSSAAPSERAEQGALAPALREITIVDITKRAKLTRPAFHFSFDSKYAMLDGVFDTLVEAADRLWVHRPPDLTRREACERHFRKMLGLWREHATVMRESAEALGLHPQVQQACSRLFDQFVQTASRQIAREREAGVAPANADGRVLATTLTWMTECNLVRSRGRSGPGAERRRAGVRARRHPAGVNLRQRGSAGLIRRAGCGGAQQHERVGGGRARFRVQHD
ncbi:TetR/AcrR family transcriptional regulator, partial [Actinoplanes missouriensis]|uniref:TetR/AcrR family transcriptional regulator n=1 Tax=Actinoplanes missouriensis TaxID=1866 RepID=UPI0033D36383